MKHYRIMQFDDAAPKMTPKPKGMTLGSTLRRRREERGMSLQDVATEAKIAKAHLWDLEKGTQRNPTIKTIAGLAFALEFDPAALALVAIEETTRQ